MRTFIVSSGWMVDWLAARAMAPASTSCAGLSAGGGGADTAGLLLEEAVAVAMRDTGWLDQSRDATCMPR